MGLLKNILKKYQQSVDFSKTFFFCSKKGAREFYLIGTNFLRKIVLFGSVTAESGFHLYLSSDFSFIYLYFAIN